MYEKYAELRLIQELRSLRLQTGKEAGVNLKQKN